MAQLRLSNQTAVSFDKLIRDQARARNLDPDTIDVDRARERLVAANQQLVGLAAIPEGEWQLLLPDDLFSAAAQAQLAKRIGGPSVTSGQDFVAKTQTNRVGKPMGAMGRFAFAEASLSRGGPSAQEAVDAIIDQAPRDDTGAYREVPHRVIAHFVKQHYSDPTLRERTEAVEQLDTLALYVSPEHREAIRALARELLAPLERDLEQLSEAEALLLLDEAFGDPASLTPLRAETARQLVAGILAGRSGGGEDVDLSALDDLYDRYVAKARVIAPGVA